MKIAVCLILLCVTQTACLTSLPKANDYDYSFIDDSGIKASAKGCADRINSFRTNDILINYFSLGGAVLTVGTGLYSGMENSNKNIVMFSSIALGLTGMGTQFLSNIYNTDPANESYKKYLDGIAKFRNNQNQEAGSSFDACKQTE